MSSVFLEVLAARNRHGSESVHPNLRAAVEISSFSILIRVNKMPWLVVSTRCVILHLGASSFILSIVVFRFFADNISRNFSRHAAADTHVGPEYC
jgi:hypothetical protein